MRLVFAGTPAVALPALEALLASPNHEVVGVVTRPDAAVGRSKALQPSPVKSLALEHGLAVLQPAKPREPDFLEALAALEPDCCPVVAYGALLPPSALAVPRLGWVNLHFSLLPAWRGAAPVQRAVLAGDEITGASTFLIEEGLDTGPVYGTVTETVRPTDTSGDLLERLSISGAQLLVATMDGLSLGRLSGVTQSEDGISHAAKLDPPDVLVDWTAPALRVDRLVRAGTPAPGPWTTFRGARLKLMPVTPLPAAEPLQPGALRVTKAGVEVGTATHPVQLGDVKPEGKGWMAARAWANGVRPTDDDRLGA